MIQETDADLRLLFIARTFPPSLGGMQNLAFQLSESMRRLVKVTMLVNHRGKKALPLFLPYAFASAIYLARKHRVQAIHLADALLAPLGVALKTVTGLPVTSSVHGLDVMYSNRFYQSLVPRALAQLDMAMPNSRATETEVNARTGGHMPIAVIPLGINPLPEPDAMAMQEFRQLAGINGRERLMLTVGRLVRRKGVSWFVEQVLPRLPENAVYIVIGEGEEEPAIAAAGSAAGVSDRVRLLGRVPDRLLAAAYRSADVFVMPNVPVTGDMEGFGLVALEASASGLPVVASGLEGITEAVHHERNGLLVKPCSSVEYESALRYLLALPDEELRRLGATFRQYTLSTYGWDQAARRYLDVIQEVAGRAA